MARAARREDEEAAGGELLGLGFFFWFRGRKEEVDSGDCDFWGFFSFFNRSRFFI